MKRGFTLVELSIVLVIIGLLIGGILVAQSMISLAKRNQALKQIEQYTIAVNLYKLNYNALPGDDPKAYQKFGNDCLAKSISSYLNRCTTATTSGQVASDGKITSDNLPQQEITLFWRHLEMGGFIPSPKTAFGQYSGIRNSGTTLLPVTVAYYPINLSIPALEAYKYGGVMIGYINNNAYGIAVNKNSFSLTMDDGLVSDNSASGIIPITEAMGIDQKVDDGNPVTGNVFVRINTYGPNGSGTWNNTAANFSPDPSRARYNLVGQFVNLYLAQDF